MANFLVLVVFVVIGSLFGPIGFLAGVVLGILSWNHANRKKQSLSALPPPLPNASQAHGLPARKVHALPEVITMQNKHDYQKLVAQLYASVLSLFSKEETSKVEAITGLLRNDDWVSDKFAVLNAISEQITSLRSLRLESPMMFELQASAFMERLLLLPRPMKNRLVMQLEELAGDASENDFGACKKFITKFVQALQQDNPAFAMRFETEKLIMQSGDSQAISTLQAMRSDPARYQSLLRDGAASNPVLKMAFGVFAGMLGAEAVKAAIMNESSQQTNDLLTQLDQDIAATGGLNNIPLQEDEVTGPGAAEVSFAEPELASSLPDGVTSASGSTNAEPYLESYEPPELTSVGNAASDVDDIEDGVEIADATDVGFLDFFD